MLSAVGVQLSDVGAVNASFEGQLGELQTIEALLSTSPDSANGESSAGKKEELLKVRQQLVLRQI